MASPSFLPDSHRLSFASWPGARPLVTKTLLVVNSGARYVEDQIASASAITAHHKDNGEYLGSVELPSIPYGNPITYLYEGKQYIVVAIGTGNSETAPPELIALALPEHDDIP